MSEETSEKEAELSASAPETSGEGAGSDAEPEAAEEAPKPERLDAEGLPIDRPVTFDDVRGGEGSGRSVAIGCTVLVVGALVLFWLIRAGLFG